MRIGIMGGTFNPFHIGHYETALEVKRIASLDRMILVPSHTSPHKENLSDIISPIHRYTMAVLGTIGERELEVSSIEIEAGGISYTYKTVELLRKRFEPRDRLFYVTGVESFEKIESWKNWESLVESIDFIINSRAGYKTSDLLRFIPKHLVEKGILVKDAGVFMKKNKKSGDIYVVETKKINVSASEIRRRIASGDSIKDMVHPLVEKYIESNKLYAKEE
jgi:nicotinate-nucleotide adenylyltransferase